jgi:hypothetical protein
MPGTRRIPIGRPPLSVITPPMVAIFDRLRYAAFYSDKWWALHGELWNAYQAELGARTGKTRPWEWPLCVAAKDDANPYPVGTPAHLSWQPDFRAREMWEMLARASCEAREARKARPAARNGRSTERPPAV